MLLGFTISGVFRMCEGAGSIETEVPQWGPAQREGARAQAPPRRKYAAVYNPATSLLSASCCADSSRV